MTVDEAVYMIKQIEPNIKIDEAHEYFDKMNKESKLGIACNWMSCTICGFDFLYFHPISLRGLPLKCGQCGMESVYICGGIS